MAHDAICSFNDVLIRAREHMPNNIMDVLGSLLSNKGYPYKYNSNHSEIIIEKPCKKDIINLFNNNDAMKDYSYKIYFTINEVQEKTFIRLKYKK